MTSIGGTSLNLFSEFVAITGPTYLTSTRAVVNDAQKTNYATLGYMLRGQGMSDVLQGGSEIRDYIFLSAERRARSYKPNARQQYKSVQTGKTWTIDWRFFITEMTWTDEEIELQAGGSMSAEAKFQVYKDLWWRKQQQLHTDNADYWEELMWAVPDKSEMEATGGQEPYSIPCFINEFPNGLPAASDQPGGTWTTKAGLDPTLTGNENWDNQRFGYGAGATGYTVNSNTNVISTLDEAFMSLDFRPPPIHAEMFEGTYRRPVGVIFCSKVGRARLMNLYRASQDRWVDVKDPYNNPTYQNAPIVYVAQLDDAAIYPTATSDALGTEGTSTNSTYTGEVGYDGPRYFLIQPEYLRPVFHSSRYFKNLGVFTDVEQPTTHVMPVNTYYNLAPRSLRRHGILYPAADQGVH